MSRYLLHFRVLNRLKIHDVWIDENGKISMFLEDILQSWEIDQSTYQHFLYHCELKQVVDTTTTWKKNQILPGDHLILL